MQPAIAVVGSAAQPLLLLSAFIPHRRRGPQRGRVLPDPLPCKDEVFNSVGIGSVPTHPNSDKLLFAVTAHPAATSAHLRTPSFHSHA
ncbi:hypothetical protein ACFX2K_009152 [Malus domestica]